MKTSLITVVLICLLFVSILTIPARSAPPSLRLPESFVTMNAAYSTHSYFVLILSDVPAGYDIINGTYPGWCAQKTIRMTQHVNHTVLLYSSNDPDLPTDIRSKNWDKINYILNHKHGDKTSVQNAIWYYTDAAPISTDANATIMVHDAEQNGTGFLPRPGDHIALPIKGIPTIQLSFIEYTIPLQGTLEGLTWFDSNKDGVQDLAETGLLDITVHLSQTDGLLINTTTTNSQGYYSFTSITPGDYYLQFILPTDYRFTIQDSGSNDARDSDADPTTGKTINFTITANTSTTDWDAGMYLPPSTTKQTHLRNFRPTADGTAGEPYHGFAHETLLFDGSRSYDRDGTITSWRWDYGDGTRQDGETTTHAYEYPGDYIVTLTVTDRWYAADVYTTTTHITPGNNPASIPKITGPSSGQVNIPTRYSAQSTDPDDDTLLYVFDWGDGTSSSSPFFSSGHPVTTTHTWTRYGFYTLRVYAVDHYFASSTVYETSIAIDTHHVRDLGYLIDLDSDGRYDWFSSNTTGTRTLVLRQADGFYRIDTDADKRYDFIYDPTTQRLSAYHEIPIVDLVIFLILVISFLLILYLGWRKGHTITFSKK